jgi:recombination protein RecA
MADTEDIAPAVAKQTTKVAKATAKATASKAAKAKKSARPTQSMLASVRSVVKKVLKDDDPGVSVDSNQLTESRPHLTSGSVVLDYLIGGSLNRQGVPPCPGWPKGMISNIYGHESSGKTTVALEAAAAVCEAGGLVCFIDWEHSISLDYAANLGCPVDDPDRFYLVQPNTLEAGLSVLFACARAGVDLIILDSVGAGVPKAIRDQALEEKGDMGRVGLVAAKWSNVLPQLAGDICESGSHVMGLSQLRKKINTQGYGGDGNTHQGGEAWKFYAHVRMSFRRVKSLKTKDYDALTHKQVERFTSAVIKAKIDKSKVSNSQQREAEFHITFGEGIDNVRDLIAVGAAHGIVNKSGSWMAYEMNNGTSVRSQGTPAFKEDLLSTPGAYDELAEKVILAIRAGGKGSLVAVGDDEDDVDESLGFITED